MNARLRSIFRPLTGELGQALPMVIGMMVIFSISITSVIVYSSSSERATDAQKKGQYANAAAEHALNTAISVLSTTTNPLSTASLPACTGTPPGTALNAQPPKANGYYCGTLSGMNWTITATGVARQGSGAGAAIRTKTITQVAAITPAPLAGGLGELWNRILADDPTKCTEFKKMIVTVPVVTAGCLKLTGDNAHPSRITGPYVTVGGTVTLKDQDSIGTSATPIPRADIAGTCTLEHGTGSHTPCSSFDAVYASTITTNAAFAKPTIDFPYWYTNAKPGPMQGCTYSTGTVPDFDKNTSYNKDNPAQQLTPNGVSYSCQVWSTPPNSGTKLGEISWDAVNQVLTVNGTIFFDGDVKATAPGNSKACAKADHGPYCDNSYSYNGRGIIYTSKKFEIEAGMCSGGDGGNDCETNPSSWDPRQNLLVIISGGLLNPGDEGFKMEKDGAVFQGAVYSEGKCKINKKASTSAPLICGQLAIKEDDTLDDPTLNTWPASLIGAGTGQVWPTPAGVWNMVLQPQLGG